MAPAAFQAGVLAWLAVLTVLVGPVAALVVLVLRNVRDIQAAWDVIHAHDVQLRERDGGTSDVHQEQPRS